MMRLKIEGFVEVAFAAKADADGHDYWWIKVTFGLVGKLAFQAEAGGGAGRFNFLVTDGTSIAATAWGDTLWYRRSAESVVVASEPGDDQPGWTEVPDRHSLTATPSAVSVRPLTAEIPGFTATARVHRAHRARHTDRFDHTDNDVSNEGIVTR